MAAASVTLMTILKYLAEAIIAVFTYLLAVHKTKNDKQTLTDLKVDDAKDKIDLACNSGSISDLLDATTLLGDAKK